MLTAFDEQPDQKAMKHLTGRGDPAEQKQEDPKEEQLERGHSDGARTAAEESRTALRR